MDDVYSYPNVNNGNNDHPTSDEMSLFVHQILLRSSSSSCSSFTACSEASLPPTFSAPLHGGFFSSNLSTLSAGGGSENEIDFDCESEEGGEANVDEEAVKRGPPRSSSKRSRAAEVHNLSEKRRRSRINEKMKALQNLIPNSNKTDKASMLDEAIEYLKQLQLQVQMLSMRNGVSLQSMCMPELLPPVHLSPSKTGSCELNRSRQMDISGSFSSRQESSEQSMFSIPNQCSPPNHLPLSKISGAVNSDTLSGMESSLPGYLGSYLLHTPSQGILREEVLSNKEISTHPPDLKLPEVEIGIGSTNLSFPFKTQASNLKECSSVAGCMMGRDQNNEALLKNIEQNLIPFPELNSIKSGKEAVDG